MTIKKVGVIGAGQMGSGIAHVCALAGYDVGLHDISRDAIEKGLATINGNMARQVRSGKISEDDRKAALERITPAAKYEAFGDCDLIIESVEGSRSNVVGLPVERTLAALRRFTPRA